MVVTIPLEITSSSHQSEKLRSSKPVSLSCYVGLKTTQNCIGFASIATLQSVYRRNSPSYNLIAQLKCSQVLSRSFLKEDLPKPHSSDDMEATSNFQPQLIHYLVCTNLFWHHCCPFLTIPSILGVHNPNVFLINDHIPLSAFA